jgi:hypothetical protein
MRWFRRTRRSCGVFALAALAVQLVLSFAHVHALRPSQTDQITARISAWTLAVALPAPSKRSVPPQSERDCDICATLNLVATGKPATAPEIIAPQLIATAIFSAPDRSVVPVMRYVLAQSRAPPFA